jgi:prevent-host-death family protein
MSGVEQPRGTQVGVRELRQNLSVYLDRVKAGETLEVTEHGRPVGLLTPMPRASMSTLDRLVAEGRATRGSGDAAGYLRSHPPIAPADDGPTVTDVLLRGRRDERS